MFTIAVTNLQKNFADLSILKSVSFTATAGDVVVLLGSSGSGKSTLLQCLNLLVMPNSGSIQINGMNFNFDHAHHITAKSMRELRLKTGMVFQQFNLWPHLTVLRNLMTAPIYVLQQPYQEVKQRAENLLAKIGLQNKINCYPQQLSGGQQQRVAIARALMMQPEVMLFDEPTSALDPEMTHEVLQVIKTLAREGMTMLIATHEISFAKEVATHALFLEHGVVAEQGLAAKILTNPRSKRLKQFLGSMAH